MRSIKQRILSYHVHKIYNKRNWYVLKDKETWPKSTGKFETKIRNESNSSCTKKIRILLCCIKTTLHVCKHTKNGWEVFVIYARQMTREKLFSSLSFTLISFSFFSPHFTCSYFPVLLLLHLNITKKSRCEIHWFLCH